ncbi:MAG: CocE/NonD family hydrolase [Planctomycetota bacterium]
MKCRTCFPAAIVVIASLPNVLAGSEAEEIKVVIERNVPVPMRDGAILRADVHRPDRGGPHPVLVRRTPYGKGGSTFDRFVKAGYIVVSQDVRGKYESDGKGLSLWRAKEHAQDGYDTVEWAAKLSGSTGKVGTFGASALGGLQWRLAPLRPPSLAAMSACSAMARRSDQDPTRSALRPYNILHHFATVLAPEMQRRAKRPGVHTRWEASKLWDQGVSGKWVNFIPWLDMPPELFQYQAEMDRHWVTNPLFDPMKQHEGCKDISVPNLDVTGWYDFCNSDMVLFRTMVKEGKTNIARKGSRIIIGPWDHRHPGRRRVGAFDFGPDASLDKIGAQIRWFDYWLKGVQNGVDKEAPVRIFVMGDNKWRDVQHWPLPRAKKKIFFIISEGHANTPRGNGKLVQQKPGQPGTDQYVYDPNDPVPTLFDTMPNLLPIDQRSLADREDILVYKTEPLTERVEVTGNPVVELFAATSALDTDWFVRLIDVAPDGLARNVADGVVRARYRNGFDRPKLLKPGAVVKYTIRMRPTSNAFLPGHRIRLDVTSSDFPNYARNHNTAADQNADAILDLLKPGAVVKYTIRTRPTSNAFLPGHLIRLDTSSSDFPNCDRNHNTAADQNADATLVVANQTIYHGGERATRVILPWVPNPTAKETPTEDEKPEPEPKKQLYPLHQAAANGDVEQVRLLISKGADISAQDEKKNTPLCYAVDSGNMEIVKLLVEAGTDINAGNRTPLYMAVRKDNIAIAEYLIALGADVNAGKTPPLEDAPYSSSIEMVKLLIAKGADINAGPWTSLHSAAEEGRSDIAELLIQKGADVNAEDRGGYTPLYYSIRKKDWDTIKLLIVKGADIEPPKGLTSLHYMTLHGRPDIVELLLAKGANVDERDDNYEFTALHYAARFGNRSVAEVLIANGANIKAKDKWDYLPIHWAAYHDRPKMVELLISKGADVNVKTSLGQTPLELAIPRRNTGAIEVLRKHGAKE